MKLRKKVKVLEDMIAEQDLIIQRLEQSMNDMDTITRLLDGRLNIISTHINVNSQIISEFIKINAQSIIKESEEKKSNKSKEDILKIPIKDYISKKDMVNKFLQTRIHGAMKVNDINTVADLLNYKGDICRWRNIGRDSCNEIKKFILKLQDELQKTN
jgi:hypothetical protein